MYQRISPKSSVRTRSSLCMGRVAGPRQPALRSVVLAGLMLYGLAGTPSAFAVTPCCAVAAIAQNGLITARETRGTRAFQFQVADPALRRGLRVGSLVYANFDTKQVSLDGKKSCCAMLKISAASKQPATGTAQLGSQTQALNPDVIALQTTSDLVAKDLGFTGLGEITFNLVNRGKVGINVPAKPGGAGKLAAQAPPSGVPISIDIWMGTSKITIQQASMAGHQTKNFKVPIPSNYSKPKCLETRNLKVVVDPQNRIKELHEDNNVTEALNSARPCPDLAIKSIKRHYTGVLNETYRVKVTIINQGNAPSPSTQVWGTSLPGGPWPPARPRVS